MTISRNSEGGTGECKELSFTIPCHVYGWTLTKSVE